MTCGRGGDTATQPSSGCKITGGEVEVRFPAGFLWGAATSPTQVEGQTVNEWSAFVARDGKKPDDGGDHWTRFEDDAALLTRLGLNAYRLGLDWGRLQHGPYHDLNPVALERYRRMLACLAGRGVSAAVTLFHFACPYWMAAEGGWLNPESPKWFADFTRKLLAAGITADTWITINEPGVYVTMAYLMGLFPPYKRFRFGLAGRALSNLVAGHRLAYAVLKERAPRGQVGIAKHVKRAVAHRRWHPLDWIGAAAVKHIFFNRILDSFTRTGGENTADFIGMNFYGKLRIRGLRDISPISGDPGGALQKLDALCDDMWEQDAGWFPDCARQIQDRWGLPIHVTECGFATENEALRLFLLREHLVAMAEAMRRGVDVRGFYYWSLVDNFEWAEGLEKRFGLIGIDFTDPSRPRHIRPAAEMYSSIIRAGKIRYASRSAQTKTCSCRAFHDYVQAGARP